MKVIHDTVGLAVETEDGAVYRLSETFDYGLRVQLTAPIIGHGLAIRPVVGKCSPLGESRCNVVELQAVQW